MCRRAFWLILISAVVLSAAARKRVTTPTAWLDAVEARYADSLRSLAASSRESIYMGGDTLSNPYYFPMFAPPMFYTAIVDSVWRFRSDVRRGGEFSGRILRLSDKVNELMMYVYVSHPVNVTGVADGGDSTDMVERDMPEETSEVRPEMNLADVVPPSLVTRGSELGWGLNDLKPRIRRPNFWTFSVSDFSLQFMQSYLSSNWYKGGESSNSLIASFTAVANYDNQKRISFENKLEMKLGFQDSRSDTLHRYKTSSDQLRMTNKLGLQAIGNWYYTFLLQSWTQFCPSFSSNSTTVNSDFMSPFELVFSIGMEYKLSRNNFTLSATMSPLAYDLIYVGRNSLKSSYGVSESKNTKIEYGSNVTVSYTWKVFNNVSWTGRLYWYSDYSRTLMEWENTISLTINRFLSTKIYLYPRFDDSATRADNGSYFQFLEQLTLGLSASF